MIGSSNFEAYNKLLRRIMWSDFIDEQLRIARENQFRASLVRDSIPIDNGIVACIKSIRQNECKDG